MSTDLPTFSVIVPTIGRPTLARTLTSLRMQDWIYGDEVILAADGESSFAKRLWRQYKMPGHFIESPICLGSWGHGMRNALLDQNVASGNFLLALDDDDIFTTKAIATIRKAVVDAPGCPHIFRMRSTEGTLWSTPELKPRNVGTPMFVFPNHPKRLGRYAMRYGGDLDFAQQTAAFYPPEALVWRPEIIALIRPHEFTLQSI